jgi:hypothetical protein
LKLFNLNIWTIVQISILEKVQNFYLNSNFYLNPSIAAAKNSKFFSYLLLAFGPDLLAAHFLFPSFSQRLAHLPLGRCPPLAHQARNHHAVSLGHLAIS